MKTLIVGGSPHKQKTSGIVTKLAAELNAIACNGYWAKDISCNDLVIWMPDIDNRRKKVYPKKDKGSVLIVSKVIHKNRTEVDAVKRIFDMHANAVICIYKDNPNKVEFKLVDALGNTWAPYTWSKRTSYIEILAKTIKQFYAWSKGQIRVSYAELSEDQMYDDYLKTGFTTKFIEFNTKVANMVENSLGSRYFGNFSTRCMKLFPSSRGADGVLVSPRNIDKRRMTRFDCILVEPPYYIDPKNLGRKYSVDTPCQVALYQQFPEIRYMIHGHAELYTKTPNGYETGKDHFLAPTTKNYYPCGDLREVLEIAELIHQGHRAINLKNHGFLILAENLLALKITINNSVFRVKEMLGK